MISNHTKKRRFFIQALFLNFWRLSLTLSQIFQYGQICIFSKTKHVFLNKIKLSAFYVSQTNWNKHFFSIFDHLLAKICISQKKLWNAELFSDDFTFQMIFRFFIWALFLNFTIEWGSTSWSYTLWVTRACVPGDSNLDQVYQQDLDSTTVWWILWGIQICCRK